MDPQYVNWLASSGLEHVPGNMVSFRYTVLFECTGSAESRTIYRSDSSSLYLGHGGMLFPSAVDVSGTMCIMRSRGRPTDRQIVYSLFLLTRKLWEISFRSRASYLRGTQKKDKHTHVWLEHRYKCVYRDQHCARYTFSRNAYPLSFVFLTLEEKAWKPIGIQHSASLLISYRERCCLLACFLCHRPKKTTVSRIFDVVLLFAANCLLMQPRRKKIKSGLSYRLFEIDPSQSPSSLVPITVSLYLLFWHSQLTVAHCTSYETDRLHLTTS